VSDAGLAQLHTLKGLKTLRIRGQAVTNDTLAIVAKTLPRLSGLTIEDSLFSDDGLAHLAGLPLEELSLFNCFGITDDGLAHLRDFTGLKHLSLRKIPILGTGLVHVADKRKLAYLRLSETGVGDEAMEHVKRLTSLTRLELRQTRVGDEGLKILEGLANVEYLDVAATRTTDAGLAHLAALGKLRYLDLGSNSGVTDAAVDPLGKLKTLKTLIVAQTGLTDDGVKRLSSLLPGCTIQRP
jgi:hypothetical protein